MCYSYHKIGEIQRAYTKLRRNCSQTFFKISVFKKNLTKTSAAGSLLQEQVFKISVKFTRIFESENFKNTFFTEYLRKTAFENQNCFLQSVALIWTTIWMQDLNSTKHRTNRAFGHWKTPSEQDGHSLALGTTRR